ncbi:MAG: hypothetical protein KJ556_20555 [Gammaproteobacteria bacterium]|nr:hypothetical protein [Gammaproteobacteria bacterium]
MSDWMTILLACIAASPGVFGLYLKYREGKKAKAIDEATALKLGVEASQINVMTAQEIYNMAMTQNKALVEKVDNLETRLDALKLVIADKDRRIDELEERIEELECEITKLIEENQVLKGGRKSPK